MDEAYVRIVNSINDYVPTILLAVVILIVGWLIALLLSNLVKKLLQNTNLDDRIARSLSGDPSNPPDNIPVESWVSTGIFWLIMFFTLVVVLQTLNLAAVATPLGGFLDQIIAFIPGILAAAILLLVAWVIATLLRAIIVRVFNASGLSRRFTETADLPSENRTTIGQTIGTVVYWLVFLLFLPAILDALNLQGLLVPVQGMVNDILAFLPNLLAAALILVVGWLVARIVRQIVTNLLAGLGIDRLGDRAGVAQGTQARFSLSNLIGTIVYVLILIPVAIAALNALDIPAVSEPAAAMLTNLLNALPLIFGAFLILAIAYFVARLVGGFVTSALANMGFDRLFSRLGLYEGPGIPSTGAVSAYSADDPRRGELRIGTMTPSQIVGFLVLLAIILFAAVEAANLLGFTILATLVSQFIVIAGQVLVGLLIFGIGLYLANLADQLIRAAGGPNRRILAPAARWAIIFFSAALALRQMGIAESIVNLAFGLMLGAIAVAVALAFGLGGRDIAARQLQEWRQELESRQAPPGATGPAPRSTPPSPSLDKEP